MCYSAKMEYYSTYKTGKTDVLITRLNELIEHAIDAGGEITDGFFLANAARLTDQNINSDGFGALNLSNIEGGPFSAILVQYDEGIDEYGKSVGKPTVIGAGTNHVVPENDPSTHGEMSAIRDATQRLGYSDLRNTVLFSSCECCPQCQAAATSVGVESIIFANDRHQAAEIGFSDAQQYALLERTDDYMTSLDDPMLSDEKANYAALLGDHDAVILDGNNHVIAYGDSEIGTSDPLESLASMNALRAACKKYESFHLLEDTTLITRYKLHPITFTTADWARIGRIRDELEPGNLAKDLQQKDPYKILYLNDQEE